MQPIIRRVGPGASHGRGGPYSLVAALAAENDDAELLAATVQQLGTGGPAEITAARMMATGMMGLHSDDLDMLYAQLDEGTAMLASTASAPLKYWGMWAVLAALRDLGVIDA